MKRLKKILSLAMIVALLLAFTTGSAFAGNLNLVKSTPKDGATGTAKENLGVKLYFDGPMTEKVLGKKNDKFFSITSEDGVTLPIVALYASDEGEDGVMLVLFDTSSGEADKIKDDTVYTLTVKEGLMDNKGNTLPSDVKITFKTANATRTGLITSVFMMGLMGALFAFTARSAKKQVKAATAAATKKEAKVDVYKEAKKTGKSVAEVSKKVEADKSGREARRAAKAAKQEAEMEALIAKFADKYNPNYRVKGPRPISVAGGKTKRK